MLVAHRLAGAPAGGHRVRARPLGSDDHGAVGAIFGSTLLLGRELPFSLPDLHRYESLCLDWYLGPGREDAAVVEADDGRVVGYALVCTDEQAHARWMRRRAARFAFAPARVRARPVPRRRRPLLPMPPARGVGDVALGSSATHARPRPPQPRARLA
jgi:hypothetical protein